MGDFRMPSLGADMDSGTVLEWRVRPGDTVHRGDIVAVVDTDKSTIEVEAFEDGVIAELLVEPGTEVPVGTPLARIAAGESKIPAAAAAVPEAAAAAPARRPSRRRRAPAGNRARPRAHVRSSPLARRRAAERGLALEDISGSGPGGTVVAADIDRVFPAGPAPTPTPAAAQSDRQESLRRAIAALMARSTREIPHYHVAATIDLSAATAWLRTTNDGRSPAERLLMAAVLLKASAMAARQVPALNGFWDEESGGLRSSEAVHLGVAVSLRGGGLVAPAIHEADRLTLDELMASLRDLVARARSGRLRSSEMADPTITVTNLGDHGADEVHGVIYPPQVALVGFGRVAERPWAQDGMLGVRPTVRASVAADHRASDGLVGARFLAALDHLLQTPEEL
jgi:pyruvate dehydrogenase E2 component (dihydrolipoamide acetyltransferase)